MVKWPRDDQSKFKILVVKRCSRWAVTEYVEVMVYLGLCCGLSCSFHCVRGILGYSKVMPVILCNFATHILVHISILITILFLILHLLTFYPTQYLFNMILIFNSVSWQSVVTILQCLIWSQITLLTSKFSGLSGLSGACYGVLRMCKNHGR